MVLRRVHNFARQGPGQCRRVQSFNKVRVVVERHTIGGHRWNRPALVPLQAEQERAKEGMVQDERGTGLLNPQRSWRLMCDLKHKLSSMYLQSGRDELRARNYHVPQYTLGRNAPWCALFAQGSHTDFRWGFIRDRDDQKCEIKHNYAS